MPYEFRLPDIGEGVVEGEIVRWLVKEGDNLQLDQPMVEVMTDKATVEIPSPRAGKVLQRMYKEGEICPVGKVLIAIEEAAGNASQPAAAAKAPKASKPAPAAATVTAASAAGAEDVLATPATRKLARDIGVDLTTVTGTGPRGRITWDDVESAKAAGNGKSPRTQAPASLPAAAASDVRVPFRGLRRKIAEHMSRSKHEAAHFTYVEEVDCTQLVGLREKANERFASQGLKISYLPFIIKATVDALKKFPQLNAYLDEAAGEIVQRRMYHIGVAAQTDDGLVVPVVRDADRQSVIELAREIDRLAAATKSGKATREELSGSTFTITSLGVLGGLLATPIINVPEVAILGVHKIARRAVVVEDKIEARMMMNLSLSVDHRLVDGLDAARFVNEIKGSLESGLLSLESI